jgi:hypothetical protein
MAVTTEKSDQVTNRDARPTVNNPVSDEGGRIRLAYFSFTQGAAAGDANSTVDLVYLPAGRKRILGALSNVSTSAFGSSRTLDIGHAGYTEASDGSTVAADEDAIHSAADISSAGAFAPLDEIGNDKTFEIYSKGAVLIIAKCEGGTIPVAATVEGYITYTLD